MQLSEFQLSETTARMKILFITRAYPPIIGGIEKQNHEIARSLAEVCQLDIIANRRGKWALPLFLPFALVKAGISLGKYDAVLLGDGVLAVLGFLLKLVSGKPVVCIVHGLDITFPNWLYRNLWVKVFMHRLDRLVAVGNETIRQGKLLGIPESSFTYIPNGVSIPDPVAGYTRQDLEAFIGRKLNGDILLTLGRLVKRKGVAWFIDEVVHRLGQDIHYIIAGDGSEKYSIINAIKKNGLEDRVFYAGAVSEQEKALLFCTADIFVQPNIQITGDMEGFGLVVLEAASYGMVVVAANIEGLKDAIQHGRNGFLVNPHDAEGYRVRINSLLKDREGRVRFGLQAREYVTKHYAWSAIARQYLDTLVGLSPERPMRLHPSTGKHEPGEDGR
jgi:phosphatidylinositol alpha-1,6-mannosyltransferase